MHRTTRRTCLALGAVALTAAAVALPASSSALPATHRAASPIQHLVVIFQENVSFDHYFGTYPSVPNTSGSPLRSAAHREPQRGQPQALRPVRDR
jgi:phospholipase C